MALTGGVNSINKDLYLTTAPGKVSKHMLVKQHMSNHYNKMARVKSSIDTSCPKAWTTSTKIRDQRKKQSRSRPTSAAARTPRPNSQMSAFDDNFASHHAYLNSPMADGLYLHDLIRDPTPMSAYDHQVTNRSGSRLNTGRSQLLSDDRKCGAGNPPAPVEVDPSPDILDSQPDKFTSAAPFTPRTLRRQAESKLVKSRFYHPPPPRPKSARNTDTNASRQKQESGRINSNMEEGQKMDDVINPARASQAYQQPNASVLARPSHSGSVKRPLTQSNSNTEVRAYSSVTESAQRRSGSPGAGLQQDWQRENARLTGQRAGPSSKPFREDPDKMKWIQEQAINSRIRKECYNESARTNDRGRIHVSTMDLGQVSTPVSRLMLSGTMQKVQEEEEELRYLEFITNVTQDILARGVFTNRALNQVVDTHLERSRGTMKLNRLPELIDKLREDLGIAKTSESEDPLSSYDRFNYYPEFQESIHRSTSYDLDGNSQSYGQYETSKTSSPGGSPAKKNDIVVASRASSSFQSPSHSFDHVRSPHRSPEKQLSVDYVDSGQVPPSPKKTIGSVSSVDTVIEKPYDFQETLRTAMYKSDINADNEQHQNTYAVNETIGSSTGDLRATGTSVGGLSTVSGLNESANPVNNAIMNQTMNTQALKTMMTSGSPSRIRKLSGSSTVPGMSHSRQSSGGSGTIPGPTAMGDVNTEGRTVHFAQQDDVFSSTTETLTDVTSLHVATPAANSSVSGRVTHSDSKTAEANADPLDSTLDMSIVRNSLLEMDDGEIDGLQKAYAQQMSADDAYEDDFDDDDF